MVLWVDKYTPKVLSKLDYGQESLRGVEALIKSENFPHLLVYGPNGAGKRTRIHCLLRMIYGNGVDKLKLENFSFQTPSNKKIDITTVSSNFHIEANPSDVGIYDRIVIQGLVKRVASTGQIDRNKQKNFKIIVLYDVDNLSKDAQHALRRTMEKYISTCRIILCAQVTSRIIPATKSRCLPIRVSAPTTDEISNVLVKICKKEFLDMPPELASRIAIASDRNLRRAIMMAQLAKSEMTPMQSNQPIRPLEWKVQIEEIGRMIIQEQSIKNVKEVRDRLYTLLGHCIPPGLILQTLVDCLFDSCDASLTCELVKLAADFDHKLQLGSKPIVHMEALIISFMGVYKRYMEDAFTGDDF